MSTTKTEPKTMKKEQPDSNIPQGMEWLAAIAERDAERSHREIMDEWKRRWAETSLKTPK